MKTLTTAMLLLFTMLTFGQKTTLLKNINFRAKELSHSLNKSGDSLILKGERNIESVTFYNSDFDKSYVINQNATAISLYDLPLGRFATEVKLRDKLIILTLVRHEEFKVQPKKIVLDSRVASADENNYKNNNLSAFNGKMNAIDTKRKVSYWIIYKINNGSNSRKMTKIGDEEAVSKIIEQNEIDLKTKTGKRNELTIFEVYDTTKFFKYKRRNPDYANASEEFEFFNSTPYYKS